jgi:hypothetical protein
LLLAGFADFELIVTDPVVGTAGILRLLDPGDSEEKRPERVGPL